MSLLVGLSLTISISLSNDDPGARQSCRMIGVASQPLVTRLSISAVA